MKKKKKKKSKGKKSKGKKKIVRRKSVKKRLKKKSKIKKFKKKLFKPSRKIKNIKRKKKKYKKKSIKIKYNSKSVILKIIRLQDKLMPKFKFRFNFSLEKVIQGLFQKIAGKVYEYKFIKAEEKRRKQIEENKRMQQEKAAAEKKYRLQEKQKLEEKRKELREEIKLEKERTKDIKLFLRKEQAIIRKEQAERQKIENCLESFYRSASSLVFQLNKRHITRHMSIFRCVDRRFETGEIFVKWDDSIDDEWLLLIYIKNNSPDEGIIIEDKSNPEKNVTHELKTNEIFKASDLMVDSLTQLLAREREKNKQNQ